VHHVGHLPRIDAASCISTKLHGVTL